MNKKTKLLLLSVSLFLTPSLTPMWASAPSYKIDSVELFKKKKKNKKEDTKKEESNKNYCCPIKLPKGNIT